MMGSTNPQVDAFTARLADDNVDVKAKYQIATELRDSIETYQTAGDYEHFVNTLLPQILRLLETVPITFSSNAPEQRLRSCLLDILLRLQTNETLKPKAAEILKLLMELLRTDNEENGVLCMKVLTSLHRAYKAQLLDQVQPFLDLVVEIYKNIPQVVNELFNLPAQGAQSGTTPGASSFQSPRPVSPSTSGDLGTEAEAKPLQKSMFSFKVLTECPIIIVLLYSAHKQLVNQSLPVFIPHIIEMLNLQAAPQMQERRAAAARGEVYTSISPLIKNRAAYSDFIIAQVKTMSFLAYALRGFAQVLKRYHEHIPEFVVRLLQDCPCELSAARKELLVATRHILSTDLRSIFIPKIDVLLNEKVLIGSGLTVHETLRPLAYSTIADLVHHVRSELTPAQIWKTVEVYSKNMQDNTLATSFQIMSAKLLLNLVETIMMLTDKAEGRQIMVTILNAFVQRFTSLNRSYDYIIKNEAAKREQEAAAAKEEEALDAQKTDSQTANDGDDAMEVDEAKPEVEANKEDNEMQDAEPETKDEDEPNLLEILNYSVIQLVPEAHGTNDLKDAKYIFKNLMNFLKTVMFGLKSCNPPPPHNDFSQQQWQESARMFSFEQITIFRRLFREGIAGHLFFAQPRETTADENKSSFDLSSPSLPVISSKDEKDLMEAFATVFIHIDPASFNEIVEAELPFLYESMFKNSALLHIPQFFLASEATSANFSGALIAFLKTKLPELGEGDPVKSNILIRLFKLCFMAVNLFPTVNENVILPHLRDLIVKSMELTTTAKEPIVYLHLLRTLFRSIGGGRFEQLYKEVLPLLQVLLEVLNRLLLTARKPQERDIYVELCLTVPVRLSVLVPHLSYLMRPLVLALNGSQELVSQGLRTLELCVDNLTATYFDPIIEPVINEVMEALWKHLRPLPYYHQHSHTTLRVLGKLGGRNRAFLGAPTNLKDRNRPFEDDVNVRLALCGVPEEKPLTITPGISTAIQVLEDQRSPQHYRVQAFKYLSNTLKLFVDTKDVPEDLVKHIQESVKIIVSESFPPVSSHLPKATSRDYAKRRRTNDLVEKLMESIFFAASIKECKDEALELIRNLCEHYNIIELGEYVLEKRKHHTKFDLEENEGELHVDSRILLSVIMSALSHFNPDVRDAGREALRTIYTSGTVLLGSHDLAQGFPMFRSLFGKLSHTCFEEEYFRKAGACYGLKTLIQDLNMPVSWILNRQVEFARTMFFVLKDVPNDVPSSVRTNASELLYYVLRECNKDLKPEQLEQRSFKQLSGLLAYELGNANSAVRDTSKEALKILSEVTGKPIAAILKEVTGVFLGPIFGKPLRALPFPMQIGYIDAITYCLGLPDTFLTFNGDGNRELTRLLEEALALVDAEDESLTSAHRVFEYSTSEQLAQLRIVCIKLLSLALTTSDYLAFQQNQTRVKIIAVFFKTLYSRSPKAVEAAHQGLKAVLAHNPKLPKELLQNGLRPILMKLSDHKRLNVAVLEGLGRLLELLTFYFKVEIGKKLLDHMRALSEPSQLHATSSKMLSTQPNVRIVVAIFNVFHLLPPAAHVFMDDLISSLFYLESHLRRQQSSPFREPIAKFLNRYPKEALQYFLPKLSDRLYGRFFASILKSEHCENLRTTTRENIAGLRQQIVQNQSPQEKCIAISNLIHILSALASTDTEKDEVKQWLTSQRSVLEDINSSVVDMMRAALSGPTAPLRLLVEQAIEEFQSLLVRYFREASDDIEIVPSVINAVSMSGLGVSDAFEDYLFRTVVCSTDKTRRTQYLSKCTELAINKGNSMRARAFVLKHIINPVLIVEGRRNGDLSKLLEPATGTAKGNTWLDLVHSRIWRPPTNDSGQDDNATSCVGTIDRFRFELLQMSALLIKLSPQLVADARKDIIKFGWSFIKMEDIMSKQSAYVLIAYFIAAYDTLPKIVVQIYVALLKTHQNEARSLVKQALDLLAPVIVKRVNSPLWAKWPRRVLSEDGQNVGQVVNIYHFIVRHADLFFEYRDHFVSNIISAMPKLSFLTTSSSENQSLAVDLAELILRWETMAKEHVPTAKEVAETDKSPGVEKINQPYSIPFVQREACITYLIRFVCMSPTKVADNPHGKRIIRVLDKLLSEQYWPEVVVKLTFFERSLLQNDLSTPNTVAICLNALEVIGVTLRQKPASWIMSNLSHLERLLEKCVKSDNVEIHTSLESLLGRVFAAIKDDEQLAETHSEEVTLFVNLITTSIQEHLVQANFTNAAAGIMLAHSLVGYNPTAVDPSLPLIMKAFGKLCRDHTSQGDSHDGFNNTSAGGAGGNSSGGNAAVSNNAAAGQANADAGAQSEAEAKKTVELLKKILDLTSLRISYLGDQRRVFLSLIAQLIEKSPEKSLNMRIIKITRGWVFSKTDLFPTIKEKAAILTKMMAFEIKGNSDLTREFYSIVVDIYDDKNLMNSELPVRMEHAFLVGTRLGYVDLRQRLMQFFSDSLEDSVIKRLQYVVVDQNWEFIADSQWLNQALQLMYGGIRTKEAVRLDKAEFKFAPLASISDPLPGPAPGSAPEGENHAPDAEPSNELLALVDRRKAFVQSVAGVRAEDILQPLIELQYRSPELVHRMWIDFFPTVYAELPKKDRNDMVKGLVTLLSKDYHSRQIDARPNVVQTLVEAVSKCEQLPPQLAKYLGMAYDAWYPAMDVLEKIQAHPQSESSKVSESNLDALAEVYAGLQEDDMFYGLWRRRSKYNVTNTGLSFEQCGMWSRAMTMYETAQIKARSGALPFGESEYGLWEDHWILCAEKLQQWDILTEIAKHEGFTDLLLECGWRVADWTTDKDPLEQSIKTVMDVPTPRRQVFETFLCLQGYAQKTETIQNLSKYCDEGIQLALRKWYSLPARITGAHIPLLHTFQQYVEFMEASQVYTSLASTTAQNLDQKSQELKGVLQAWRERLPNIWDDINVWGDLVTWRQHAFGVINKVYLPLIPALQQQNGGSGNSSTTNSYAYRGYHEIAWIINRFAHVARKHNMPEVCISQLTKIYTLPNIEIQEAFLKLREQAKCHYQNPNEMNTGLDVISNTNLVYFGPQQKAEFFTLKGMFLAKLGAKDEANQAFATAVQIDLYVPKAWAEWGYFNDRRFKEQPDEILYGSSAISCYLQAAGLYKNAKARKLLGRILWLISLDDAQGQIAQAFDQYRGDVPVWYWITYIPQLLTSLSHKEARLARHILIKIAKSYPQALHFHLRTAKEDYAVLQRQALQAAAQAKNRASGTPGTGAGTGTGAAGAGAGTPGAGGSPDAQGSPQPGQGPSHGQGQGQGQTPGNNQMSPASNASGTPGNNTSEDSPNRQPWEHVEEIMGILKTAYPLLALSLETIVDQIYHRFKCPVDEDAYRLIVALLNDGIQYMGRLPYPKESAKLPPATENNITRFAESVLPPHIKTAFEADFVRAKPNLEQYVHKLRKWFDRFEAKLDARPQRTNLEALSPPLSEFHYQKFEDVEVPGQYLENKDNNMHFVKIDRFMSTVDVVRGSGTCYRRLTIRGHDGSLHPFAVQYPAARHCRREERVAQLFKILKGVMGKRKECRKRNLQFTLPAAVPLTPHIRIVQDDPNYVSMQAVYEDFCRRTGQDRYAPLDYSNQKLRAAFDPKLPKPDVPAIKMEILNAIQATLVPGTVLRDYFVRHYRQFEDFWLFRKQFAYQYAGIVFMTILMSINNRYPHKLHLNLASGNVWTTEMLPTLPPTKSQPQFHNGEPVPFRLTPNIQTLMGPTATEGLFAMAVMVIAKGLSEPEFELDQYLSVFVRDELISWYTQQHRPSVQDQQLREIVRLNIESITKRAASLAAIGQGNTPANQTVIDLISQAVNPRHLALTDNLWMPYF